jgi:hypothetical protein
MASGAAEKAAGTAGASEATGLSGVDVGVGADVGVDD